MGDAFSLQRFVDAQDGVLDQAIAELSAGQKQGHWMWFVFPQLAGLGRSPTAIFYALASIDEAASYFDHPLLGPRLLQAVETVLRWRKHRSAEQIFGAIDAQKFRSSMTLFDQVGPGAAFAPALDGFFGGQRDAATLALLRDAR